MRFDYEIFIKLSQLAYEWNETENGMAGGTNGKLRQHKLRVFLSR